MPCPCSHVTPSGHPGLESRWVVATLYQPSVHPLWRIVLTLWSAPTLSVQRESPPHHGPVIFGCPPFPRSQSKLYFPYRLLVLLLIAFSLCASILIDSRETARLGDIRLMIKHDSPTHTRHALSIIPTCTARVQICAPMVRLPPVVGFLVLVIQEGGS